MVDLGACDGFDWDEGNLNTSWAKHRVSSREAGEVFFNMPLLLNDDTAHSRQELRAYVLGKTNAGRLLFIAFTLRSTKLRVISARPMSRRERTIYEQASS